MQPIKPTRLKLTLPSGATCTVRKLCTLDFQDYHELAALTQGETGEQMTAAKMKVGMAFTRMSILRACSPLRFPDNRVLKIVEKPLDQLADNEITVEEFPDADIAAIVSAVSSLTNQTPVTSQT